jgi:hypothetical protein
MNEHMQMAPFEVNRPMPISDGNPDIVNRAVARRNLQDAATSTRNQIDALRRTCPPSRELSVALTYLQTAALWLEEAARLADDDG